MKKVLIIGAGWLGIPLAKVLSNCFIVKCFYRSEATQNRIIQNGLSPLSASEDWSNFDIVIICFPPGRDKERYPMIIRKYLNRFSNETKVILTSSTGIYPNETETFTETSVFETPINKIHLKQAEEAILSRRNSLVLRLGGLIGEDRHPIKFISGKPLKNPDGPINLVHQNDVIRVIQLSIENSWTGIINVTEPSNMTRIEYYSREAKIAMLEKPLRIEDKLIERKISTSKLTDEFGFIFENSITNFGE